MMANGQKSLLITKKISHFKISYCDEKKYFFLNKYTVEQLQIIFPIYVRPLKIKIKSKISREPIFCEIRIKTFFLAIYLHPN